MPKLTRKQIRLLKSAGRSRFPSSKDQKDFDREITKGERLLDRRDRLRKTGVSVVSIQKQVKAQNKIVNKLGKKLGLSSAR